MKRLVYVLLTIIAFGCANQEKKLPDNFDFGTTENGSYKNQYFDMEVTFNPDWVVQDKQQMNDLVEGGSDLIVGEDENLAAMLKASQVNTAYLLTVFKHEMGAAVAFNPSFVLVAENTKNAPGIKNGSDYLFHAKKMLEQAQMQYYFEKDVYEKQIGEVNFHIMEARLDYLDQVIVQEYSTTVMKGFSLSFIVSYTTEEERAELYEILDGIKLAND